MPPSSNIKRQGEKAVSWRDKFLVSLASARAEKNGTDKTNELKQLRSIEQQQTTARNIKRMQRNATIQIFMTDENGRHVVTDKEGIEDACIQENISRFTQSENTPPMQEPLLSSLGFLANMQDSYDILQGTYNPPPSIDPYAALLLQELRTPDNVRRNPMPHTHITPEQNKNKKNPSLRNPKASPLATTRQELKTKKLINLTPDYEASPINTGFPPGIGRKLLMSKFLKKQASTISKRCEP